MPSLFAAACPPFSALLGSPAPGHSAKGTCKYGINSPGKPHHARAALNSCCALEKIPCGACWPQHQLCLQCLRFGSTQGGSGTAAAQEPACHLSIAPACTAPPSAPWSSHLAWDFEEICGGRPLALTSLLQHTACLPCQPRLSHLPLAAVPSGKLLTQPFQGVFAAQHTFPCSLRDGSQCGAMHTCESGM